MHTANADLPPYHPRVIQASLKPLVAALVPRYVHAFSQDETAPKLRCSTEVMARAVLKRTLRLLTMHQGVVPLGKALSYLMSGSIEQRLTATQAVTACRLLELLMECSELIVTDSDGSVFWLHPEWAERFCKRYEQQEASTLQTTAQWESPQMIKNPHYKEKAHDASPTLSTSPEGRQP